MSVAMSSHDWGLIRLSALPGLLITASPNMPGALSGLVPTKVPGALVRDVDPKRQGIYEAMMLVNASPACD